MSNPRSTTRRWALQSDERMILCCSSTRHRRFTDDLVAAMSMPSGSHVRLRYSDDVCDPTVRDLGDQAYPSLVGLRALIAHVGFESSSTAFLPLRVASVVELRTVGSFTFLDVELGDFVEAPVATEFGDLLVPIATCQLPAQAAGEEKPSGYFCQFLSSPAPLFCGQDAGLWERVGKRFLAAISNSIGAFPYIFNISIVDKRSRKPVSLRDGTLMAPAVSQLELHIRTLATKSFFDSTIEEPVGTLTIAINHPDARLTTGKQHAIDTTRNVLLSRLTTNISLRPAYGSLTVTARRCHPESAKHTEAGASAEGGAENAMATAARPAPVNEVTMEMPVTVGRPCIRLVAILSISVGLAAHAFDLDGLADHANYHVWLKAGAVFAAALIALWMGLKPQAGD